MGQQGKVKKMVDGDQNERASPRKAEKSGVKKKTKRTVTKADPGWDLIEVSTVFYTERDFPEVSKAS